MAATEGNLINFDIIENQKENIQSLPSGRSVNSLASVFSPLAAKSSPSNTEGINGTARAGFEKELAAIDESDDPLDIYDRYVKWTFDAYPSTQATPQSRLLPLLERATKAFLSSPHYKNDSRHLRLWLHYIRLFSDAPKETFAFLARHGVGENLALYYEEFSAWLETHERWDQAREVYHMGIEREARPIERLTRKFGEFERRYENRSSNAEEPSSPALPSVRPALATKHDPFASTGEAADPQDQSRQMGSSSRGGKKSRLEIFADTGTEGRPDSSSNGGTNEWESIGTLKERKKENTVGARPWVGETIKSDMPQPKGPKLSIFKDQSRNHDRMSKHCPRKLPPPERRYVNPRTGRVECVSFDLEAVYPDSNNPSLEFSFEQILAKRLGYLRSDWKITKQEQNEPEIIKSSDAEIISPLQEKIDVQVDDNVAMEPISRKIQKLKLNDVNDENAPPEQDQTGEQNRRIDFARRMRREEKANKTRKIKVRKVKAETQTIQTNLDSPQGPRIRRNKKEPTMTLHTKAAQDEIYDIFNESTKTGDLSEEQGTDESEVDDDDFSSTGESTGTGHISVTTSEFEEETQGDATAETKTRVTEGEATGTHTKWTDFDTRKDVPGRGGDDHEDEHTGDIEDGTSVVSPAGPEAKTEEEEEWIPHKDLTSGQEDDEGATTPTSPTPAVQNRQTRYIPIPPADFEAPTRPYRDPEQVAQSKLPFMTPIMEKTESSLGNTATAAKRHQEEEEDYFNSKTPCPKGTFEERELETPELVSRRSGETGSSPFEEVFRDVAERHPEPQGSPPAREVNAMVVKVGKPVVPIKSNLVDRSKATLARTPASKSTKDIGSKGPVIKDTQCNPMDESIRATILREMHPPLSTFKGFIDRSQEICGRKTEIRKYCKSLSSSKSRDRSASMQRPPVFDFAGAERQFAVKKELGTGAYAPVYLTEQADGADESDSDDEQRRNRFSQPERRNIEALKMEEPPSAWEFYILRSAKRRLGVSRAADSVIDAYEMHLFKDEGYLIEEFREHGTLLDLVNLSVREQSATSGFTGTGMDEALAMFFTVELLRTVEGLHNKGIIHGDLKADNVLMRFDTPPHDSSEVSSRYMRDGTGGWSCKGISLIDFGRGMDMRAFTPNVQFIADWETGDTDCAEMRELRPWTFQADYHGLAAIMHTMLFGRYIETVAEKGASLGAGAAMTFRLKENLKRYWQTEIWGEAFSLLLNSARHVQGEEGGRLPALRGLKRIRERMEEWLEGNSDKGVGLRGQIKRMEGLVAARRRA